MHIICDGDLCKNFTSWEGDMWLPPVELEAGQSKTIKVYFDWTIKGATRDWSVTAWGTKGSVSVTESNGLKSSKMP